MTRAATDRSHLSIGEVLSLLQEEFPDVTISKIRFLESQGLLDPERTPSGYRKFYEGDIDRLRWILRQQQDHYLPLKVIKDRLDNGAMRLPERSAGDDRPTANGAALLEGRAAAAAGSQGGPDVVGRTAVALDERPGAAARAGDTAAPAPAPPLPDSAPAMADVGAPPRGTTGATTAPEVEARAASRPAARADAPASAPGPRVATPRPSSPAAPAAPGRLTAVPGAPVAGNAAAPVSLTAEELAQQSGITIKDLRDLERYGLIESFMVGDDHYYDGDALVVAQTAAGFLAHGIEARHIRTYKVAIDREAGLFEQIVLPLLKQRNPEARQRARDTVNELIRLGQQMRGVLLHQALRDHTGPS
jgi:DNA-binding transcriptional MerR regulator